MIATEVPSRCCHSTAYIHVMHCVEKAQCAPWNLDTLPCCEGDQSSQHPKAGVMAAASVENLAIAHDEMSGQAPRPRHATPEGATLAALTVLGLCSELPRALACLCSFSDMPGTAAYGRVLARLQWTLWWEPCPHWPRRSHAGQPSVTTSSSRPILTGLATGGLGGGGGGPGAGSWSIGSSPACLPSPSSACSAEPGPGSSGCPAP